MTFKQLEAIYWVVSLGGFAQAARQLNMTQSALSRRIHELETSLNAQLFDRERRSAHLTRKGEEVFAVATELLHQRNLAMERLQGPEAATRRVRLGVTELTAMTWLPRLSEAIEAQFPTVVIDPYVQNSAQLCDMVERDKIDMAIVASAPVDRRYSTEVIAKVKNAWFCRPGLIDTSQPTSIQELASHRLLTQGEYSGTGKAYGEWMRSVGLRPQSYIASDNLIAMIGLTISGLGISYLPEACVQPMVEANRLSKLTVRPRLPDAEYSVIMKSENRTSLHMSLVKLARRSCDFTRIFQTL